MERSPYVLAALASTVPGLDPIGVQLIPSAPEHEFDVAFIQDQTERRWVVRAPRNATAAARMEAGFSLLNLLARRVSFGVPAPRAFVELKEGGRAAVYPYLPGHNIDFAGLTPGPGAAVDLARAIANLHNVDPALVDEAGSPVYDADAIRTRRLGDLDRAAETGRVPTTLLARWERALEDVALWRFAATPVHGDLTGDQVLVTFEDPQDAASGKVRALTGWEDAHVGDPAEDFAGFVAECDPLTLEAIMEAYAHARVERPDANLLVRARLASEMALLDDLQRAIAHGWEDAIDAHSAALRHLEDEVTALADAENDYKRTSLEPVAPRRRQTPPPLTIEDDEDDDLPALEDDEDDDLPALEDENDDRPIAVEAEPDPEPTDTEEESAVTPDPTEPADHETDGVPDQFR